MAQQHWQRDRLGSGSSLTQAGGEAPQRPTTFTQPAAAPPSSIGYVGATSATGEIRGFKWNDLDGDGIYDALDEPGLAGVTIFVDLNGNGVLDLGGILGDYNDDGRVDTADYVVWRKTLGTTFQLPNEGATPGVVTQADFDVWRAHYGASGGSTGQIAEPRAVTMDDNPATPAVNETGTYRITGVPEGTYIVREIVPDGYHQTSPGPVLLATDTSGRLVTFDFNFDNFTDFPNWVSSSAAGIAKSPNDNMIYGLTSDGGIRVIDLFTGSSTVIGNVGAPTGEGDLAFDATTGDLYVVTSSNALYRLSIAHPSVGLPSVQSSTLIGTIAGVVDSSGAAFDSDGNLYVYADQLSGFGGLMLVNKTNASVIHTWQTENPDGGDSAGLTFDPTKGIFYGAYFPVFFSSPGKVFKLDTTTSTSLAERYTTIFPEDVSGLVFLGNGVHLVRVEAGTIKNNINFGNAKDIPLPDGDDVIHGGGEDDILYGDNRVLSDARIVSVGTRRDTIEGGAGNDSIFGQEADDVLWGNDDEHEIDTYSSGGDKDYIDGGEGEDEVRQTVNNDQDLTDNRLTGQGLDDLFGIEHATLTGGRDANFIDASSFTRGWVHLVGESEDDVLDGEGDGDTLIGTAADDVLEGVFGANILRGGTGSDTYVIGSITPARKRR